MKKAEKKDVDFLKSHKTSVGISLDSFDAKTNNRTRPDALGGNYEKAIRAIDWFDGYEGLNVITTVTKHNAGHLAGLVRLMHSKKVPWQQQCAHPQPRRGFLPHIDTTTACILTAGYSTWLFPAGPGKWGPIS